MMSVLLWTLAGMAYCVPGIYIGHWSYQTWIKKNPDALAAKLLFPHIVYFDRKWFGTNCTGFIGLFGLVGNDDGPTLYALYRLLIMLAWPLKSITMVFSGLRLIGRSVMNNLKPGFRLVWRIVRFFFLWRSCEKSFRCQIRNSFQNRSQKKIGCSKRRRLKSKPASIQICLRNWSV